MKNFLFSIFVVALLTSCTTYTEKRSEALSRAVAATADSIQAARFDLASQYSKEAEKLAFPPKNRIKINTIVTETKKKKLPQVEIIKKTDEISNNIIQPEVSIEKSPENLVKESEETETESTLRLVIPENLRHAKLLVENSEEWEELKKTEEFNKLLQDDLLKVSNLKEEVNNELQKQLEMNNKMIQDLNILQKKVLEKDLAILWRNIIIVSLIGVIGIATYLRIKGIL